MKLLSVRSAIFAGFFILLLGTAASAQVTAPIRMPPRIVSITPPSLTITRSIRIDLKDDWLRKPLVPVKLAPPPPPKMEVESHGHPRLCHLKWLEPVYQWTDDSGRRHYTQGRYVEVCDYSPGRSRRPRRGAGSHGW